MRHHKAANVLWAFPVLASALFTCANVATAQTQSNWDRFLPHVHYFRPLLADVQETRMGLGMMNTNVFKYAHEGRERPEFIMLDPKDSESDTDVNVGIGGSFPLVQLADWGEKGGMVAVAQLGVLARFRIEYPTREHTGDDWYVGMPVEWRYNDWSGRFGINHRSSHMGDELHISTNAQRIEFGGEYFNFLFAKKFADDFRAYGGATWNFRSYTEQLPALRVRGWHDTWELHAGVDGGVHPWKSGHAGVVGGLDYVTHERDQWHPTFGFAIGPEWRANGRATRLMVRHYTGLSAMGEFFLTPEKFTGVEWVVDF